MPNHPIKKAKKVKEKGWMLLLWGKNLGKKFYPLKVDARRELIELEEANHCGTCECELEKGEVVIIPVEITYTLPLSK